MSSCLGIFIDKNLIKYAKLRKDNNTFKVESFNTEVFDNLELTLKKVINQTNSQKTPISINIKNELYNYFNVFSGLGRKDITKALNIEFEMLCQDKGYAKKSLESRYILVNNEEDRDKYKVLYISANKGEIYSNSKILSDYKLYSISPISTSITNLVEINDNENIAIINIENETKITTIFNKQINRVDILDAGLESIIEKIHKLGLSWKETYNVFKTTIINDDNIDENKNEYIDLIIPTISRIIREAQRVFSNFKEKIDTIYITGLGATIGNIDLYFQEEFKNTKCKILKPFFVSQELFDISKKEYIEVNSAIALALDGLEYINKDLNFAPSSKINSIVHSNEKFNINRIRSEFKKPFNAKEKLVLRAIRCCIIAIIGFSIASGYILNKTNLKIQEAQAKLQESSKQIEKMDSELSEIESYINAYNSLIGSVDSLSEANNNSKNSRVISKDAIPNMLKKIMTIIPKQVQIISIENVENNHIVIQATSEKYEQLGYFLAAIKSDGTLANIKSTPSTKSDSLVQITIEGDLK